MKNFKNFKVLSQEEAVNKFMPEIEKNGKKYKKFTKIIARKAKVGEIIDTITSDGKETTNKAKKDDYVVTNVGGSGEEYIISKSVLKKRYKSLGDDKYIAIGECTAIKYDGKEMKFMAIWDEEMVLKTGDMVVTTDGKEVYRIAKKEFNSTYKLK